MDPIQQLWDEHLTATFPRSLTGEYIGDYDAVMLDADIAGCVSTFLQSQSQLDKWRVSVLQQCYLALSENLDILDDYPKGYYGRLKRLAELVLAKVNSEL